jgi:hypothetical protein
MFAINFLTPCLPSPVLNVHPGNVHSVSEHFGTHSILTTGDFVRKTVRFDVQQHFSWEHEAPGKPACFLFLLLVMRAQSETRVRVDEYSGWLVPKKDMG